MESPEQRLASLGFELPSAPSAVAIYRPAMIIGDLCYTSGHLPLLPDGSMMKGIVGAEVDQQHGYDAARQAGLAMLSTLKATLGDLGRVAQVVKLFGMVASTSEFTQQPAVINGCSELMKAVFGDEAGIGTRSAVGVAALPLGVSVEIEGIFLIRKAT
ncbi:MAG: RidA family protein [Planctomycetota bacterium]